MPLFAKLALRVDAYSREYVLDELEKRHVNPIEDAWKARDFRCVEIAPDNYLLT